MSDGATRSVQHLGRVPGPVRSSGPNEVTFPLVMEVSSFSAHIRRS